MNHTHAWYDDLAVRLGHRGFVTLAEVRQEEARTARAVAATAKWSHVPGQRGLHRTELDGATYTVTRESGKRTWQIEAWPSSLTAPRYGRTQGGIATLAEAKGLALAMPCARCGLAAPLILMTRRMPARPSLAHLTAERWRCADTTFCEAERNRLTDKPVAVMDLTPPVELILHNPSTGQSVPWTADPASFAPDCPNSLVDHMTDSEPGTAGLAGMLFPDGCDSCGLAAPHRHTNLIWDETWGLIPGPDDVVERLS